MRSLSLIMITYNAQEMLEKSLESVHSFVDDIVIIDSFSTDDTANIAHRFNVRLLTHRYKSEGEQRNIGIKKAKNKWILILDDDEVVSAALKKEIIKELKKPSFDGYFIPFQSHFLGRPVRYGGENYKKLILFDKTSKNIHLSTQQIHAELTGKRDSVGLLKNKMLHYSYRSIPQMYKKFTDYAFRLAVEKKIKGERTSPVKVVIYPLHMFYARFIKDKGYKDGFFRIPLDLGFAYMEFLTYAALPFVHIPQK